MRTPSGEQGDPATLYEKSEQGDRRALDTLVGQYLPRLHAFVRTHLDPKLRDREDSIDVVQSICSELVQHRDQFEFQGEPQFRGWLFTSARNKIREKYRFHGRERRDVAREDRSADLAAGYAGLCSPSVEAASNEQLSKIEAALDALPEESREVISLVRIAGLTSREAAEHMGKTPAAVRKLLGRALVRLSVQLGEG